MQSCLGCTEFRNMFDVEISDLLRDKISYTRVGKIEMNNTTVNLLELADSQKVTFLEQAYVQRIDTSEKMRQRYIKIYQCSGKCATCYKKFCFGKEESARVNQKITH